MFTGTQLIYKAMGHHFIEEGSEERCRICGGRLDQEKKIVSFSEKWTAESQVKRIDQPYCCQACKWFLEKNNRGSVWNSSFAYIATETKIYHYKTPKEFFQAFLTHSIFPAVFMIKGRNNTILRKHTQLKSIHAVSISENDINIIFSGIRISYAKNAQVELDGIASARKQGFIEAVYFLKQQIHQYLQCSSKYKNYFAALKIAYQKQMTPELLLACFFASELANEELKNNENV